MSKKNNRSLKTDQLVRAAGILLPLSSLASPFGIGDLGSEAYAFADFLEKGKQRYWQLLPLNPVEQGKGYSPYSSTSSIAGNILLISPELLSQAGLLDPEEIREYHQPYRDRVTFAEAEKLKMVLFDKAFQNFSKSKSARVQKPYNLFCKREKKWLDDYAWYHVLKNLHSGEPWYSWPEEYKFKVPASLKKLERHTRHEREKTKWLQYVFFSQWHSLKQYCNAKGIRLFGDLPFYVSYDSCDVWAHPELFNLDRQGNIRGVAGVPPDYFNADGQLWGMPVFNWKNLRKQNYDWWLNRIRKNLELYDLLRLDHFRAFSDFWEVPASEKTAKHGEWKPGPGPAIFKVFQKVIGELPFVAEDLGDINDAVYQLRDAFTLPGMKVLQFAFGDNMAESDHIPHNFSTNFIVYTGTHDNNTTCGWYRKETDTATRNRLKAYTGMPVNEKNVHQVMARLAYASVATIAILPMQDVLGLDENARINTPASVTNNWEWRLLPGQLREETEKWLSGLAVLYKRTGGGQAL